MNRVFCLVVSLALLPVCRMVTESDAVPKRETTGGVSVVAVQYDASMSCLGSCSKFTNLSHYMVLYAA